MRKLLRLSHPAALVMLASFGSIVVADTCALAQTRGMERRQDRRGTRQEARTDKHECNASGGASRADCRQMKRGEKQEGRQDRMGMNTVQPHN